MISNCENRMNHVNDNLIRCMGSPVTIVPSINISKSQLTMDQFIKMFRFLHKFNFMFELHEYFSKRNYPARNYASSEF